MGSQSIFQPRPVVLLCFVAAMLVSTVRAQTLATTVPLVLPSAIAIDVQGNLYLAETGNHVIRKVDSTGHITVVAGNGVQGFGGDGGPVTAAQLDSPQGLAVDAANLYIADTHNHRIRKVDLTGGTITTIAGNSASGSDGDGGPATAATLDTPTALALDNKGNLYFADTRSHRIRKISAESGFITTVAGTGTQGFNGDGSNAATALLDSPGGLAVDGGGNLYISDSHNHRVRRIDGSTGVITTLAGTGVAGFSSDSGSATTANLALPQGLTVDQQGNIYLADTENHRIRRIDTVHGTISTIAGEGTQDFAGDGRPAIAASLDSPRSTTLASEGLLVIADTGNRRIREIASGGSLQTVAGLGATTPSGINLSGPAVVSYGAGRLTATLNSDTTATGAVTFLDTYKGASSTVGIAPLMANAAILETSSLLVGKHAITATYIGDLAHTAAQSTVFGVKVSPLALTPVVSPSSSTYGEPVPAITGTLIGLLPHDQANVWATFAATATPLSPAGSYPITVTLTGAAAENYIVATAPTFTISRAAAMTVIAATNSTQTPISAINMGDPVILIAHVTSQTTGVPTGAVTIFDGASIITTGKVNSNGDLAITTSSLAAGSHSFTASYAGDGNFVASTSSPASLTVNSSQTAPSDFNVTPAGATTQSIVSGNSANFTFSAQVQGGLSSPIALSASGLPNLATASFNPAYIPPGSSSPTFTLTVATPKTARLERMSSVFAAVLLFPIGFVFLRQFSRHNCSALLSVGLFALPLLCCTGCGDRIYTDRSVDASKTYIITVTGTSSSPNGTALKHTAAVTLIVLPSN
jgi:sugar lactone lactonase YvrE